MVYFHFLHFFTKNKKMAPALKKLSKGATECLFHLPLQVLVATIIELKARAGTIFRNCKKSNVGNPGKGDESANQNKKLF